MSCTFTEQVVLVALTCGECGMTFAVPKHWKERKIEENNPGFYCPNGHSRKWLGESDKARLERELAAQKLETQRQRDSYFAEQRKHEETQKKMQRLKKRTAAGVCPCCKRTFSQLARHMQSKHVAFVKEHGVPVVTTEEAKP